VSASTFVSEKFAHLKCYCRR